MGSRLPPTNFTAGENCDLSNGDESCTADLSEITHTVVESGDGKLEKPQLNFPSTQMDQEDSTLSISGIEQSVTDKLIPAEQRVNGARFGTVIGHTYTDNKHTNLETWLPEALNQTQTKRKVLMDLEHRTVKFIAEEPSLPYLLLKSTDAYQRLAIYRVTAYFGLACRPKDGDLIAWRTPYTRIPEGNIRFEAMLRELREEKEGIDQRQIDQSGDMRSMQAHPHIRDPQIYYHRQPYSPMLAQPMRFRNPNIQNRFGPSQQPFPYNVTPSHPLSVRVPPPIRRYFGGGTRFRGSLPPGGNYINNHQSRWVAPTDAIMVTHESFGSSGASRSRSVPNVISSVPDADAHRSSSGVSIKSSESHTGEISDRSTNSELKTTKDIKDSSTSGQELDCESNQSDIATTCLQPANTSTLPSDNHAVSCNSSVIGQPNNKAVNTLSQINDINDGNKYGIVHQMVGMTLEPVSKDNFSGTEGMDRMAALTGASVMSSSSTGNAQLFQEVAYNSDHQATGHQATMSPVRMATPSYPPPMTVPRPSTLSVYNSHAYAGQPMTPGQPTMVMMTDSQGYIQASPQIGHSYPVATAPPSGNALDPSPAVPIMPQPQSVLYLAPQQMSHQSHHQSPSIIYINPIQPNPVMSSGGQSTEYTVAQYRDMPPPTAGPPPSLSVPYSSYQQVQQVVTSVPPPGAGGVTYYTGPGEVIYAGANATNQQQQQQSVNNQEYVQYTGGTALPFAGYTLSPYLPQQVQSPAATGYVNYFPTAAAYPGTYATSTPLVFQSATGYSVPPPPTEMMRQSSEVHHPVQWVPVAGGKGTGFLPTVHIAPSTPTRALTVADVQLVGQPITVHPFMPFAQLAANQRMEVAAPIMTGANPPTYRLPPPTQTTYHKSASFGIRPSGGSFRSTGPAGIAIPARPSMQYQ